MFYFYGLLSMVSTLFVIVFSVILQYDDKTLVEEISIILSLKTIFYIIWKETTFKHFLY